MKKVLRNGGITLKLTVFITIIVLITVFTLNLTVKQKFNQYLENQITQRASQALNLILVLVKPHLNSENVKIMRVKLLDFHKRMKAEGFQIREISIISLDSNRYLASSNPKFNYKLGNESLLKDIRAISVNTIVKFKSSKTFQGKNRNLIGFVKKIEYQTKNNESKQALIIMKSTPGDKDDFYRDLEKRLFILEFSLILVVFIGVFLISMWISKSILKSAKAVELILSGQYDFYLATRFDELGVLNKNLSQLKEHVNLISKDQDGKAQIAKQKYLLQKRKGDLAVEKKEETYLVVHFRGLDKVVEELSPEGLFKILNFIFVEIESEVENKHGKLVRQYGEVCHFSFSGTAQIENVISFVEALNNLLHKISMKEADFDPPHISFGAGIHQSLVTSGTYKVKNRQFPTSIGNALSVAETLALYANKDEILVTTKIGQTINKQEPLVEVTTKLQIQGLESLEIFSLKNEGESNHKSKVQTGSNYTDQNKNNVQRKTSSSKEAQTFNEKVKEKPVIKEKASSDLTDMLEDTLFEISMKKKGNRSPTRF